MVLRIETVVWYGDPSDLNPIAPQCSLPKATTLVHVRVYELCPILPCRAFFRELQMSYTFALAPN